MHSTPSLTVLAIAALVWFAQPGAAQNQTAAARNQESYTARLTTVPMDGGMRNTVAGSGAASAVLAGTTLTVNGRFQGLRSSATAAELHRGLVKGVRGSSVAEISVSKAMSGTLTGSLTLTPDQVQGLRQGQFYIQISSEKAPDGNLWGWLLR